MRGTHFAIWWFISCLFATQITAYFILKIKNYTLIACIVLLSYFTAHMVEWNYSVFLWGIEYNMIRLPLSIDIVPMALVFYLIGFSCKTMLLSEDYMPRNIVLFLLAILLLIVLQDYRGVITIPCLNMVFQTYGYPLINITIPLICFVLIRDVSLLISKVPLLKEIFIAIGQAALPVMFLHLILPSIFILGINKVTGLNANSNLSWIALGIVLPYIAYCVLNKFEVTKKLFLGIWR